MKCALLFNSAKQQALFSMLMESKRSTKICNLKKTKKNKKKTFTFRFNYLH
jgi:hypothetical protein